MNKSVVFFQKPNENSKMFPIVKAFNIPEHVNIPVNATTFKISNLSLHEKCRKVGAYKMIGEFFSKNGIDYFKVGMVMEVLDVDVAVERFEGIM